MHKLLAHYLPRERVVLHKSVSHSAFDYLKMASAAQEHSDNRRLRHYCDDSVVHFLGVYHFLHKARTVVAVDAYHSVANLLRYENCRIHREVSAFGVTSRAYFSAIYRGDFAKILLC